MGKRIADMTEQEITAQRARSKRNYKYKPKSTRKQRLINELKKQQATLKNMNVRLGLQLAICTIEEWK